MNLLQQNDNKTRPTESESDCKQVHSDKESHSDKRHSKQQQKYTYVVW